jgi:hypothetical protein
MNRNAPAFFRKADVLIVLAVIALAAVLFLIGISSDGGETVVISVDGRESVYPLSRDTELTLESEGVTLTVTVKDGQAFVSRTDCKSAVCSHSGKISRSGQIIVCAPAKVSVRITGEGVDLDAVTG